ncbi:MAG: methyltransferase domain-containing protein [Bryobacteraceae bacterium]|nr:methyltransferase domain-containing protein [Bryobacteraceae bacterium]
MSDVHQRMREDWNARAREDAGYYVAFGARGQSEDEFFATAKDTAEGLARELKRLPPADPRSRRALEIGCGPGRLMRPMSAHFGEIHGVDVSDEMIARARRNLNGIPHAHVHVGGGSSLGMFASESFDVAYSYAVFQHIPSKEVVYGYLRDAHRVLKSGGLLLAQFNGLAPDDRYDTWSGVRFSVPELLDFAAAHDFQVLTMEGASTQYLWTAWYKRAPGWAATLRPAGMVASILAITNAQNSEPVAPASGRFASVSMWVRGLPGDAGLHHLEVRIGRAPAVITYLGPPDAGGTQQVNALLPEVVPTGLLPVEILWLGEPVSTPGTLRVIPPGPSVPFLLSVTDGVNLVSGSRIETGCVKVTMEEVLRPEEFGAEMAGRPVESIEHFCTAPRLHRYEFNFRVPAATPTGPHQLKMWLGRRRFAPYPLEVV